MDKLISHVLVLFTLSLVSERIISWMKLYFGQYGKSLPFFSVPEEDISHSSNDPALNITRDRKILGLNICIGILTAFLMQANLFDLLRMDTSNPAAYLGWESFANKWKDDSIDKIWTVINTFFGCILSGLCMSLGSKFWHDTLDLLFYTKNLKNKLTDQETYKLSSLKQVDNWINSSWPDMVKIVFDQNKESLSAMANVVGCGIVSDESGKEYIEVQVSSSAIKIPKTLAYTFADGTKAYIPVKIVVTDPAVAHSLQKQTAANSERPQGSGTIGLIVTKKDDPAKRPLYLSCYHVLKSCKHDNARFSSLLEEIIIDPENQNSTVGTLVEGILNDYVDAALCTIENDHSEHILFPCNGIRKFQNSREARSVSVRFFGATSKEVACRVNSIDYHQTILYTCGNKEQNFHRLHNMIAISSEDGGCPSQPGDSGAILTDNEKRVIGMLVGANGYRSFVIPITTILNTFNLEIPS